MSEQTVVKGWRIDLTDEEVLFIRRGLTKECLSWTKGESGIPKILEKLHDDFLILQDNKVEEMKKSTLDPMRLTLQGFGSLNCKPCFDCAFIHVDDDWNGQCDCRCHR